MRFLRYVALAAALMIPVALVTSAHAQIAVGIGAGGYGPAPVCEYGYYNSSPYACAPYGYYGPEWFDGGLFIGVGPWYRGYGYRGMDMASVAGMAIVVDTATAAAFVAELA